MSFPQMKKGEGFTLIVTATIRPDKVDEWLGHFWTVFEHISAEPECLSFELFRFPDEPNKVRWIESWSKSPEWFMTHQATKPYMKPATEATDPLIIGEKQWEILERFGGGWARAQEGVYQKPSALDS